MNELLFIFVLLLPIAWYAGFTHGKRKEADKSSGRQTGLSKTYFTGLNYLLNEEADKAIDTFVSMLEIDSETVETHLALGSLFRKRGEVDRAIRIHQNLIARPSLTKKDRRSALQELGYDYMGAGLLDRAENIFKELSTDPNHKNNSLIQLLVIYQQTKDWNKAIESAAKIDSPMNSKRKVDISHFYCELAEESLKQGNHKDAMSFIKKAHQADSLCVRATLISAKVHFSNEHYKQAIKSYKQLLNQDIAFLTEAIDLLIDCFDKENDQDGLYKFLNEAINNGGGISTILAFADLLRVRDGDRSAAEYIATKMSEHPSIRGLLKLIELHIEHANENAKPSLKMLYQVVLQLCKNKPVYHCNQCGFDSKILFWQCPSCKSWGEVKPIQGIEGE